MSRIFISYRRESAWALAGHVYEKLAHRFGRDNVFIDLDDIEPGVDFVDVLERTLSVVNAMIVIIDRNWVSVTDATGKRRLSSPHDFVRQEVATALRRDILLIPILESGSNMPDAVELPEDLAKLADCRPVGVSQRQFSIDIDRIAELLEVLNDQVDIAHAEAVKRILADEGSQTKWEQNYWIYDSINVPRVDSGVTGSYSMREPIIERLNRLDFEDDARLQAARKEAIALIRDAPIADKWRSEGIRAVTYNILQTSRITELLEEIDEAVLVRGRRAVEHGKKMRVRAYRDAEVADSEVERWRRNASNDTGWVPEHHHPSVTFGNVLTRQQSVLDYLAQMVYSTNARLEVKRASLVELIQSAPLDTSHGTRDLDLWLTPETKLLLGEVKRAVREHGEAAEQRPGKRATVADLVEEADNPLPRVFISYRRQSGWALAGWLYQSLVDKFGERAIFIDIDAGESNATWSITFDQLLRNGDALIAIIDRNWICARDERGNRLLDSPNDLVRVEIATALRRGIHLVQLLEQDTIKPTATELPDELGALTHCEALEVGQRHFNSTVNDITDLLAPLREKLELVELGANAVAAARILSDELECQRWEKNSWVYEAIHVPEIHPHSGCHYMRAPVIERLNALNLSDDPQLEAMRDQAVTNIEAAPIAHKIDSDHSDIPYDLHKGADIAILLNTIDEAVRVRGKLAREQAKKARLRAYRDRDVSDDEIAKWVRNWKLHQAIHIPESSSIHDPLGTVWSSREALLARLRRLDFSTDVELDGQRNELVEIIVSAPRATHDRKDHLDLCLTLAMQSLRADIDRAVEERGKTALARLSGQYD